LQSDQLSTPLTIKEGLERKNFIYAQEEDFFTNSHFSTFGYLQPHKPTLWVAPRTKISKPQIRIDKINNNYVVYTTLICIFAHNYENGR